MYINFYILKDIITNGEFVGVLLYYTGYDEVL